MAERLDEMIRRRFGHLKDWKGFSRQQGWDKAVKDAKKAARIQFEQGLNKNRPALPDKPELKPIVDKPKEKGL